jgi:hypothetical protein
MKRVSSLLAISMVPLFACSGVDEQDPRDGTFSGKADAYGVSEGTPEARGVLRVVNELTQDELDDEVPLSSRAAAGIIEARSGADEVLGTADDHQIATLTELDEVPYIGEASFGKLLAYAEANGYIVDTALWISYRYGNQISASALTLNVDGEGELEERYTPTNIQTTNVAISQSDWNDLTALVELAKAGTLQTRDGSATSFGSSSGTLVVYPESGGGPITIQEITRDNDGDGLDQVTTNDDPNALGILSIVTDYVARDMPLTP